jgi:hypothetical protein
MNCETLHHSNTREGWIKRSAAPTLPRPHIRLRGKYAQMNLVSPVCDTTVHLRPTLRSRRSVQGPNK